MHRIAADYPDFGFDGNVGYSTPEHRAAIIEHGPSPLHRRSFASIAYSASSRLARIASRTTRTPRAGARTRPRGRRRRGAGRRRRSAARGGGARRSRARVARRRRAARSFARLRGPTAIAGRLGPERRARPGGPSPPRTPAASPSTRDQVELAADAAGRARCARRSDQPVSLQPLGDHRPRPRGRGCWRATVIARTLGRTARPWRAERAESCRLLTPCASNGGASLSRLGTLRAPPARRRRLRSRPCSPPPAPSRCSASRPARSGSRSTCARACRRSRSSGCRTRRCASRASGCGRRSSTPGSSSRSGGSPPTSPRPTCARLGPGSTSRSPPRCSPRPGSCRAKVLDDVALAGELALDGSLRPVAGALAMAEARCRAGLRAIVVAVGDGAEAALVATGGVVADRSARAARRRSAGTAEPAPGSAAGPVERQRRGVARPRRPARSARAAARARGRSSRRPQPADHRAAGGRQVDGGTAAALDPAAARSRRGDRGRPGRERLRPAGRGGARRAATVSRPASHDLDRGADRGRQPAASR